MKYKKLLLAATLSGVIGLSGCSSTPVPLGLGNEMTYQSDDRPKWASDTFYSEDGFVYATGISNRMPTERTSKESALTNAMANLASGINSKGVKNNTETQTVTGEDDVKVNKTRNSSTYTSELRANESVYKPVVESSYFEIWANEREKSQFFKYYVLVKAKI